MHHITLRRLCQAGVATATRPTKPRPKEDPQTELDARGTYKERHRPPQKKETKHKHKHHSAKTILPGTHLGPRRIAVRLVRDHVKGSGCAASQHHGPLPLMRGEGGEWPPSLPTTSPKPRDRPRLSEGNVPRNQRSPPPRSTTFHNHVTSPRPAHLRLGRTCRYQEVGGPTSQISPRESTPKPISPTEGQSPPEPARYANTKLCIQYVLPT